MGSTVADQENWGESVTILLVVEAGDWPDEDKLETMIRRSCRACAEELEIELMPDAEISAVFVNDDRMKTLNNDWRNQDKPTNVLSFPSSDRKGSSWGPMLGDIVFAFETISRESREIGIPLENHLCHLIVHGILHLFGYDHISDEDAVEMETTETHILEHMSIPDPYGAASV